MARVTHDGPHRPLVRRSAPPLDRPEALPDQAWKQHTQEEHATDVDPDSYCDVTYDCNDNYGGRTPFGDDHEAQTSRAQDDSYTTGLQRNW